MTSDHGTTDEQITEWAEPANVAQWTSERGWHNVTESERKAYQTEAVARITKRCQSRHRVFSTRIRCEEISGHDGKHFHSFYNRSWDD